VRSYRLFVQPNAMRTYELLYCVLNLWQINLIWFTDVNVAGSINFCIISDWSKSYGIIAVVSNHGVVGLEQQGVIFNFIMFIAGILVCIRKPKDDIALGLLRYRDDSGWKTVLWVGFSVFDLSFVQYWSENCSLRSSSRGSWANTCRLLTGEVR